MADIPLRNRKGEVIALALVDADDMGLVSQYRWRRNSDGYAQTTVRVGGRDRTMLMHRLILGLDFGDPRQSDHKDRNRLNNSRTNLRIATRHQNGQNVASLPGSSSRYRGVSWHKRRRVWQADVEIRGTRYYLGTYRDEEEAARVAANFRREHMPYSEMDRNVA